MSNTDSDNRMEGRHAHSAVRREAVGVGVMARPQSSLGDFYREMDTRIGVE